MGSRGLFCIAVMGYQLPSHVIPLPLIRSIARPYSVGAADLNCLFLPRYNSVSHGTPKVKDCAESSVWLRLFESLPAIAPHFPRCALDKNLEQASKRLTCKRNPKFIFLGHSATAKAVSVKPSPSKAAFSLPYRRFPHFRADLCHRDFYHPLMMLF